MIFRSVFAFLSLLFVIHSAAGAATTVAAADSDTSMAMRQKAITLIVRSTRYMRETGADKADIVARPLAGDLWIIVAEDRPEAIALVTVTYLKSLGLTPQAALALGKRNMSETVAGYLEHYARNAKPGPIDVLKGSDAYQTSLLAFPESWAAVVKAKGGSLLCAAPLADTLVCADGTDAESIKTVHDEALATMADGDRPLSAEVLAWRNGNWVAVGGPKN